MKTGMIIAVVAALAASNAARALTDEEVKTRMVDSWMSDSSHDDEDNRPPDRGAVEEDYFVELCDGDTNRCLRLICELAQTNELPMAEYMVEYLGSVAATNQLPFLYSIVTNAQYGYAPVRSILRIEGITSNSVAAIDRYLFATNVIQRNRSAACSFFFKTVKSANVSASIKQYGESVALRYAGSANLYFRLMDEAMICAEPAYQHSKRRLAVLRSVNALGVSSYQIDYVTNAINELVAYPEAELPE